MRTTIAVVAVDRACFIERSGCGGKGMVHVQSRSAAFAGLQRAIVTITIVCGGGLGVLARGDVVVGAASADCRGSGLGL